MNSKSEYSRRSFLSLASQGIFLFLLTGCSTLFPEPDSFAEEPSDALQRPEAHICLPPEHRDYAIHQVGLTTTVPRLAEMYGVSEESILRANHLRPGEPLTPGRTLIIPHPTRYENIVPVYRNNCWRYIIVHHTACEIADALKINRIHLQRGFVNGMGYDFLIDDGTMGKGCGEVEVGPRWTKQEVGAHCAADRMNFRGIGIALVGNFDYQLPYEAQMITLTKLVAELGDYYQIPISHVLGHRQVPGAHTDCPGNLFPWERFEAGLRRVYNPGLCRAARV